MFKKNIPCIMQAVDYDDYRMFEVDIYGSKEMIKIESEGLRIKQFRRLPSRSESGAFELREVRSRVKPTIGKALYYVADNMYKVLTRGVNPLCGGSDYLKVERVIEAITTSASNDGSLVYIKK